jgi:hypothetical protein
MAKSSITAMESSLVQVDLKKLKQIKVAMSLATSNQKPVASLESTINHSKLVKKTLGPSITPCC